MMNDHYKSYLPYFLLLAIGLIIFFTVAFTFSFKEKVYMAIFQKPFSFADEQELVPSVELIIKIDDSLRRGVVDVENGKSNLILRWKTENEPTVCLGRFWGSARQNDNWSGPRNVEGGEYVITDKLQTGIYVYSIDCSNQFGDASGSSLVINAGAKLNNLKPHITSFEISDANGHKYDIGKSNQVQLNTNLKISLSSINTETPFGICVANGSWPTIYQNVAGQNIRESFVLDKPKIYNYKIFCSNENGYDTQEMSFFVR